MGQVLEGSNGVPVKSSNEGRLWTEAVAFSEDHERAVVGESFVLPLDGIGTNGAEHICVMKNSSAMNLIVTSFTIFVATFKDSTRVKVFLNETFTYAANGTDVVPVNLRSGVVGGADGVFKTITTPGTDITTFGGTSTIGGIFVFDKTPIKITKRSGWVIPSGQVWSLYNVGNDNTFYGSVSFYFHV